MDSGATGAQGAQSLVGGPMMAGAEAVPLFYVGGLDGSWPMHHFERDGRSLDWRQHLDPPLRMFRGQVNRRISLDMLGKVDGLSGGMSHGYSGPEDEHLFDFVAWQAARASGTMGGQLVLEAWAANLLHRYVLVPPGTWLTANRGMG